MADSIKTNSTEQDKKPSVKPDRNDEGANSRAEDEGFESLQKELLLRARKRAEAASSNPPPPVATDDYVPASPTRIGQPAFRAMDSDNPNGKMRRDVEQADTLPSFPAPAIPASEPEEAAAASAPEKERKSPDVVLRAQVVVADVEEQTAKEERKGPERRESRRVMLRDSSVRASTQEDVTGGVEDSTASEDSTDSSEDDYIQSEAIAFDEFTADGPLMTSTYGPKRQQPSSEPDISELIPSTSTTTEAAEPPRSDAIAEPDVHDPRRSKKFMILGLASAAVVVVAVAGLFVVQKSQKPKASEKPKQEPGAQTTSTSSPLPDGPTTQVTSNPEGAELVHQGAVVGNTPTKVKRPTYEQIFLLRLPGYESQLLRISPSTGEKVHVTLRPSETSINQKP